VLPSEHQLNAKMRICMMKMGWMRLLPRISASVMRIRDIDPRVAAAGPKRRRMSLLRLPTRLLRSPESWHRSMGFMCITMGVGLDITGLVKLSCIAILRHIGCISKKHFTFSQFTFSMQL
jgi:hypothetical protein